jgi:hypothetical protein
MITKKELYTEILITLNKLMYENNKISFSIYKKTNDELVKRLYNKE